MRVAREFRWTLSYVYEEVTLDELKDLCDDIREHPSVDVLFAAFVGYEPPEENVIEIDPMQNFLEKLMTAGLGKVDGWS